MTELPPAKATIAFLQNPPYPPNGERWPVDLNDQIFKCAKDLQQQRYSEEEASKRILSALSEKSWDEVALAVALSVIRDAYRKSQRHPPRTDPNADLRERIMRSTWFVNIKDSSENAFVDFEGCQTLEVDPRHLKKILADQHDEYKRANQVIAYFTYDPHGPLRSSRDGIAIYNRYAPPEWKKRNYFLGEPIKPKAECPSLIIEYLNHFTCSDQASIEYTLDWLANALHRKNETMLVAIGDPGIGKGVLGTIMKNLFGEGNFYKARDQMLKSQFNGAVRDCQLLFIDEIAIRSKVEVDRLKDLINDTIEIEEKGVDAIQARNFASIYIASNRNTAIRFEPGDRRFSIIELTKTPLEATPLIKRIDELTNPELANELALYLHGREIRSNLHKPFRAKWAAELVEANLSDWEHWLIFEWTRGRKIGFSITISDIQKELSEKFPRYKPPGREKIIEVSKQYNNVLRVTKRDGRHILKVVGEPPHTDDQAHEGSRLRQIA